MWAWAQERQVSKMGGQDRMDGELDKSKQFLYVIGILPVITIIYAHIGLNMKPLHYSFY